jgi:hypothetical protein
MKSQDIQYMYYRSDIFSDSSYIIYKVFEYDYHIYYMSDIVWYSKSSVFFGENYYDTHPFLSTDSSTTLVVD